VTAASEQIYVFRAGSLGDAIVSLPAWSSIAERHPGKPLHLITPSRQIPGIPDTATVYGMTGHLGEVVRYGTTREGLAAVVSRVKEIGRGNVYCLMPERSTRAHLRDYAFLRAVVGLRPRGIMPAIFANFRLGPFRPAYSSTVEWKRLLQCVSADDFTLHFPMLVPTPEAHGVANKLAAELEGRPFMVACPGSKMPAKRWPVENYKEVFRRFLGEFPKACVVLLGSPAERAICEEIAAVEPARIANRAGDFSLDESAAVCARAVCYFGNDTGAMHVAAAMGKQCVAVFSARDYEGKWEPFGHGHVILRQDVPCKGCMLEECVNEGLRCLISLDTGVVARSLFAMWSQAFSTQCR
jgi:ADP-heptose:LPS heptosyltransferase